MTSKSIIANPLTIAFSKKNNSVLFVTVLKNPAISFNNTDLVEMIKFEETILFFINEFIEICDFIDSSSIFLFLYIIFAPIVFAFNLKFNGSSVNLIFFNLTSKLLLFLDNIFFIWLLNLSVSIPIKLK